MPVNLGIDSGTPSAMALALDLQAGTMRLVRAARAIVGLLAGLAVALSARAALGERPIVSFEPVPGGFPMADGGYAAPLLVDPNDWPGVVQVVRDLQADVERVCGVKPPLHQGLAPAPAVVVVGTLGKSAFVEQLVREGRVDRRFRDSGRVGVLDDPGG